MTGSKDDVQIRRIGALVISLVAAGAILLELAGPAANRDLRDRFAIPLAVLFVSLAFLVSSFLSERVARGMWMPRRWRGVLGCALIAAGLFDLGNPISTISIFAGCGFLGSGAFGIRRMSGPSEYAADFGRADELRVRKVGLIFTAAGIVAIVLRALLAGGDPRVIDALWVPLGVLGATFVGLLASLWDRLPPGRWQRPRAQE